MNTPGSPCPHGYGDINDCPTYNSTHHLETHGG